LQISFLFQRASRNWLILAQTLAHSRSGVSKIEARLSYVDDKTLLYLAVLKVQVQELFPTPIRLAIESTISSGNLRRRDSDTDFHLPLACSGISADGVPIYLADLFEIRKVMDENRCESRHPSRDSIP
jgi:hypothetical protein